MLGWMLRRGDNASNAIDDADDTTQINQPDTPAPVFAARAFKSALFGTPRRTDIRPARTARRNVKEVSGNKGSETPSKPAGILLTPGTGTTRRKRVSFGYDVARQKECSTTDSDDADKQKRSTTNAAGKSTGDAVACETDEQDEWEEEEEEEDSDEPVRDVTLDLNEPHSQSGKFWKEEFEKYHKDAKLELEKLLKYKQLAKSYAKQRDAETLELAERLRDEQIKVLKMEKMIAENTSNIKSAKQAQNGDATMELAEKLVSQTALATEYREKVQALESKLEDALFDREQRLEGQRRRRQGTASPAMHKTLTETQRELRQAKSQLREMGALREHVASLESKLQAARQAAAGHSEASNETSRTKEIRAQVRKLKEDSRKKDQELLFVRTEFEAFRDAAAARDAKILDDLQCAHSKIIDQRKEIKTLKVALAKKTPYQISHVAGNGVANVASDGWGIAADEGQSWERDMEDKQRRHLATKERRSRCLREEFREEAVPPALDEGIGRRMENGGVTRTTMKQNGWAPEVPIIEGTYKGSDSVAEDAIDLLSNRFARLGGPETGGQSRSSIAIPGGINLAPERQAAALARIEKRMAEKKRARARNSGKENVGLGR